MLVLSIDVGIVNIGLCLFDTEKKVIVRATSVGLVQRRSEIRNELEYVHRVMALVERERMYFEPAEKVIIERQMKRQMIIIQHILATLMVKKDVEFIAPQSVKRWFRSIIQTENKRKKGGVRGVNHKVNKREAVQVFTELFPDFVVDDIKKLDDIADSTLQAAYWAYKKQSTPKTKTKKILYTKTFEITQK